MDPDLHRQAGIRFLNRRPLCIAHRGAHTTAPENSLRSIREAARLGADGVEVDLQLCTSGEVVLYHDYTLTRLGSQQRVELSSLAELRRFYLGDGERIPTLDELLEDAPVELLLNLEIKTERFLTRGLEEAIVERVRAHGAEARVLISSFNPIALWRVRRRAPELRLGFLFHGEQSVAWRSGWNRLLRPDAVHPEHQLVDASLVQRAHRRGQRVHPWTCDRPHSLRRLLGFGVDGIITNDTKLLKELLAGSREDAENRPATALGGRPLGA